MSNIRESIRQEFNSILNDNKKTINLEKGIYNIIKMNIEKSIYNNAF